MDLGGKERRTSKNLQGIIGLVKNISICFANGGLYIEWEDNATYQQEREKKQEKNKGKCIKTLG